MSGHAGREADCEFAAGTAGNLAQSPGGISFGCDALLAGYDSAVTMARMALYDMLSEAHARWPGAGPEAFVDDLAQDGQHA